RAHSFSFFSLLASRCLLICLIAHSASALEIRVHPADFVYAYEVDPARALYTVVLQNVAIVQKEGSPVTVESLEIQALSGDQVVQKVVVPAGDLDKVAQRLSAMEAQGVLKLYDFHFQTSRYLAGLHLSSNRTLGRAPRSSFSESRCFFWDFPLGVSRS